MTLLGHLRLWMVRHRLAVGLLAAMMAVTVYSVVNAPAAQAYTCPQSGASTLHLNDGSASATLYVSRNCSDGRSRWSGVVRDIRCDGRTAYLQLSFYSGAPPRFPYRYEQPAAGNGCGTTSTFSYSSTNADPYRVLACARAWNAGPSQSSGDCANSY